MIFMASMGREFSVENSAWGHGAFTKALLDGIRGAAADEKDDILYLFDPTRYVQHTVPKLTNNSQHPTMAIPQTVPDYPIAVLEIEHISRDYSIFAGFWYRNAGHCFSRAGPNMRTRRRPPWAVRVCLDPIPAQACLPLPTGPSQRWCPPAVMPSGTCGRVVGMWPSGTSRRREPSTTGAIAPWGVQRALVMTSAQHSGTQSGWACQAARSALAPPGRHDPHRAMALAVRLVVEDGVPSGPPAGLCGGPPACWSPVPPSQHGGEAGGAKRLRRAWTPPAWTGPGRLVPGRGPRMHALLAPAACLLWSRIAAREAPPWPTSSGARSHPRTSGRCSGVAPRPWRHAPGPCAAARPLARRSLPRAPAFGGVGGWAASQR